jgi:hypothetical protein
VQSVVLSEAETPVTNVNSEVLPGLKKFITDVLAGLKNFITDVLPVPKTVRDAVLEANTADAVASGTSIRYHAVPSLAIAQSRVLAAEFVIGKNRFTTEAVFGVVV